MVEARLRKHKRAQRRIERMKVQANQIADQADIDDSQKMKMLERLYKGSKTRVKRPDKVYVVATSGGKRKSKTGSTRGTPTMVDPRMKKEKRGLLAATKRKAKVRKTANKRRRR